MERTKECLIRKLKKEGFHFSISLVVRVSCPSINCTFFFSPKNATIGEYMYNIFYLA